MAAQVKGSDGPDWVLACVLMDVQAQVASTGRIAYGHCERMQWDEARWVIGAGTAPLAGALDVARHRPGPPGRVVHLGQRRPVAERGASR